MTISVDNSIPRRLDHLDRYLERRESGHCAIKTNCEKKIIWNNGKKEQTGDAIVYIHGFSASRMETWPLCDRLAERMGANLFYTRLSGHGQDGHAMGDVRVDDWLADGLEAVTIGSLIGRRVILVGTSTGGTLAAWLAAQPATAPLIHRLILLSPNFFPKNPMAAGALWPPTMRLYEKLFGGWRSFAVTSHLHERYWTASYPIRAVTTMMQLVCLTWRTDLKRADMPALMMLNPRDRVINVTLARLRFRRFSARRKALVFFRENKDEGRHVLAGDILAGQATERALAVIRDFLDRTAD